MGALQARDVHRVPALSDVEAREELKSLLLGHTDWLERHGDIDRLNEHGEPVIKHKKRRPDHEISRYWRKVAALIWAIERTGDGV